MAPEKPNTLIELADAHFNGSKREPLKLNPAEREMIGIVSQGDSCRFTDKEKAGKKNVIHSKIIAWLCKEPAARSLISDAGIGIVGARIEGFLNLQFAQFKRPLRLHECEIEDRIALEYSALAMFSLEGSRVGKPASSETERRNRLPAVNAHGAQINGGIFLNHGFEAQGEVRLLEAEIAGTLDCSGGEFKNENGAALSADRAQIKGSVFLRKMSGKNGKIFQSFGEVRLLGAEIGGNLECDGSAFKNQDRPALNIDGAKINRNVFLRNGFTAAGGVCLLGTEIGGNLDCAAGEFKSENGKALSADRAKITGGVFLRNRFAAIGEVSFPGAEIGGNLDCTNGKFRNEDPAGKDANKQSLNADSAKIKGYVLLNGFFEAFGEVRFRGAEIGGNLDCIDGRFHNPRTVKKENVNTSNQGKGSDHNEPGIALRADRAKIAGSLLIHGDCAFDGRIDLVQAEVMAELEWHSIQELKRSINTLDKPILDLCGAHVRTLRIGRNHGLGPNGLFLHGLTYDSVAGGMPTDAEWWIELIERQEDALMPQPYEQAAKVLREQGHHAQASTIHLAMERKRWSASSVMERPLNAHGSVLPLMRWLIGVVVWHLERFWHVHIAPHTDYVHRPKQAIATFAMFLLGGCGVFSCVSCCNEKMELMIPLQHWAYVEPKEAVPDAPEATPVVTAATTAAHDEPTTPAAVARAASPSTIAGKEATKELKKEYPKFRPWVYAIETFTPLIKLRQADYWHANMHTPWGRRLAFLTWIYTCIGWILTTLLVAALTGLVRK